MAALIEHIRRTTESMPTKFYAHSVVISSLRRHCAQSGGAIADYMSNIGLAAPDHNDEDGQLSGYSFRIISKEDQGLLNEFLRQFNEELNLGPVAPGMVEKLTDEQQAFFLCDEASNQPLVLCCAAGDCQIEPGLRILRISCMYTPPEHRGKGLARALLAKTLEHLRQTRPGSFIRLYVNALFPPVRKFYRTAGFTEQDNGTVYECVQATW
eukprot:CAMPEP_0181296516 /NCGR_PEP_ID=MMETSP1101-20121128/4748_1 /TAXON_ID=46948 /ORGANISM="Rhodomonas abbreviata, Strain Caron Lab Isolate" /LENGTH=210 /DNA_ID=CAMNT_0023401391 /DNA_START=350 /DNA_END=979 /DNA_ORIENTATION=+